MLTENNAQNNIAYVFILLISSVLRKEIQAVCLPEVLATLSIEFLMRKLRMLYTTVAKAYQIGKLKINKLERNTFRKFATSSWTGGGNAPCNYEQRQ
jgi:hypothetical protein